jgi:hypothetical protein
MTKVKGIECGTVKKPKHDANQEYNYTLHIADLTSTLFCKMGYCTTGDEKIIEGLLHLQGMDVQRNYDIKVVTDGSGFRTKNNQVVNGGVLYTGYKRLDYDEGVCDKLLNTMEGVNKLANILKLEEV